MMERFLLYLNIFLLAVAIGINGVSIYNYLSTPEIVQECCGS